MTTILMKEYDTGVTIGFDARVTQGTHSTQLEAAKVFANGGVIFGVAGDLLDANVIRFAEIPRLSDDDWNVDRYVTVDLIPALREALDAAGALSADDGKIKTGSTLLLVVRNRVYEVSTDTSWLRRTDRTYAIGSGWQFSLGALSAGASIRAALEIAGQNDIHTGDGYTVVQAEELLQSDNEEMRAAA